MSGVRVLVVDDEADIVTILSVALRRAGYRVTVARDGAEAVDAMTAEVPDLVLLDVMMPKMDGFETLRWVRADPRTAQVPVIMLTAKTQLADKMAGFARGADDYVAKPFDIAEVLARTEALLRRTAEVRVAHPLLGLLGEWATSEGVALFGRDLEAAREIQRRLTPAVPATLAGLEAAGQLEPSTVVGGDFFDVVPAGGRVAVAVGDVTGKGITGALLMVMVRTLLREITAAEADPAAALARLNVSLCRDMPPAMFVTVVLAVIQPGEPGRIALASGGHPAPVLLPRAGAARVLDVSGLIVGAFPEATFATLDLELTPGDALVLFSDGVLETPDAQGGRPGLAWLLEFLEARRRESAVGLARAVTDAVVGRGGGARRDDVTVFVLRR